MMDGPQKEHSWLQQLLGDWAYESEGVCAEGEPPFKTSGTERVRQIGGLWIVAEGEGTMPDGGTARTMLTLGYDPAKGRYVGTFVASMMTHLWIYAGSLDETGRVLTLDTTGPSMEGDGKTARYQDVIELKGPGERLFTARVERPDGTWRQVMAARYRRRG
jgi:hypothetical protein